MRDSQEVTATIRELRAVCTNDECGHTFLLQLSVVRTIRPSAIPNPEVQLPFANPRLCRPRIRHANDDTPLPANDDGIVLPAAVIPDPG